jgi:hypothetical protein
MLSAQTSGGRVEVNPSDDSELLGVLFPSRVKTFVKASYDPDDRPTAPRQGNDDGFSGTNGCEAYRMLDQGNPMAVIADFAGRRGVMGLFFRNFWSDAGGVPMFPGENNRTRIWIDGQLRHDMLLADYFRNQDDPRGQIAPFAGPFTGHRSGGHLTHAQLTWNQSFRIGLWDDAFANAARFHRVAVTIATPEGELPMPDLQAWQWIAEHRGQWPHHVVPVPVTERRVVPPSGVATVQLAGPGTVLEVSCQVGQVADWEGMWARFSFDAPAGGAARPQVDVPLRLLGALTAPPHRFAVQSLLLRNDGDRSISNYFPMPFARSARLEFVNRNSWPVNLTVRHVVKGGAYPQPFGHFTAIYRAETTGTNEPFQGPRLTDCRGTLRFLMLEDTMDDTGRIPGMNMTHLEGDLCVRVNGNRGRDHSFDASETSIGRWGWYLTPADRAFASDTSFQSGPLLRFLPNGHELRRIMGSTFVFDPIHFVDGIDIVLEHGVQNESNADYGLVAFLYVEPGAARRTIAEIDIGTASREAPHQVQFTEYSSYQQTAGFFRDQFFGTGPITDSVRHVRDFLRFRVQRPSDAQGDQGFCVGYRIERLGSGMRITDADVLVDGFPAGLLHSSTHSSVFPWVEGGETEVELPRALTDGKASFVVEIRPRPGSDALRIARAWVYQYTK